MGNIRPKDVLNDSAVHADVSRQGERHQNACQCNLTQHLSSIKDMPKYFDKKPSFPYTVVQAKKRLYCGLIPGNELQISTREIQLDLRCAFTV
jgi:hypothetical protein